MNILVTGGCGYIGTLLIKKLLSQKHNVICIDNQLFGNYLKKNKRLKIIKENILNINNLKINKKIQAVIHLSSIANDPMADLKPNLSWETSSWNIRINKICKKK